MMDVNKFHSWPEPSGGVSIWNYQGMFSFRQIIERASCSDGSYCFCPGEVLLNHCSVDTRKCLKTKRVDTGEGNKVQVFSGSFWGFHSLFTCKRPAVNRFACGGHVEKICIYRRFRSVKWRHWLMIALSLVWSGWVSGWKSLRDTSSWSVKLLTESGFLGVCFSVFILFNGIPFPWHEKVNQLGSYGIHTIRQFKYWLTAEVGDVLSSSSSSSASANTVNTTFTSFPQHAHQHVPDCDIITDQRIWW